PPVFSSPPPRPPGSPLFPYTTLFRSRGAEAQADALAAKISPQHASAVDLDIVIGERMKGFRPELVVCGGGVDQDGAVGQELLLKIGRAQSELQSLAYLVCRLLLEKKK